MRKWEVDLTLIETWIGSLDDEEYDHLIAALEQLEEYGPGDAPAIRGHPRRIGAPEHEGTPTSPHQGRSPHPGALRLRHQSRAIMLVAGDKAGNWTKWYATNVPIADRLFTEHQQKMKQAATAAKSKASKGKKR